MAEVQEQPISARTTSRLHSPRIHLDMTPMVDLGFLLLTFFILTSKLVTPTAMGLDLPREGPGRAPEERMTLLLDARGVLYACPGAFEPGSTPVRRLSDVHLPPTLAAFAALATDSATASRHLCELRVAQGVRYGRVVDVLDEVKQAGITALSIRQGLSEDESSALAAVRPGMFD
ncbi:MAG: biopolymer transporter ExbD [Flavobacteriales bacterium]|nr:MAG: biopolymer transporter ExbD [Flavobacteriales bacterium]